MEIDRDALMATFLAESEEQLEALEQTLLALDRTPDARDRSESVAEIFRIAHTLKGNAETVGLSALGACAHALESVLDGVRTHGIDVSPGLVSVLLGAHDALRSMLTLVADGSAPELEAYEDVMDTLTEAARGVSRGRGEPRPVEPTLPQGAAPHARKTLRVNLEALDRLVTGTGQLSIAVSRLRTLLQPQPETQDALAEVDRLFGDLREQAMSLRLVPIGPLLRQQQRSVRDLAAAHDKLVRLVLEGEEVEVDASVLEGLRDPITHMVRNAVDHAIESPDARRAAGKAAMGSVTLSAKCRAGSVTVTVSDDGAGFNRERIHERAREMGLLDKGMTARDEDLLRLVLLPGFSTAQSVTRTSGRGVGMDVVAKNVAELKGVVDIRSTEGAGTAITIRVPLTLAVMSGFAVRAGAETFVIPMDAVRGCVAFPSRGRATGRALLNLRGEPLPCVRLTEILGFSSDGDALENVVVLEHQGDRAGLLVDDLLGGTEAVVKPLSGGLDDIDAIAGSTILGNGRVALILDVPAILRGASTGARA